MSHQTPAHKKPEAESIAKRNSKALSEHGGKLDAEASLLFA